MRSDVYCWLCLCWFGNIGGDGVDGCDDDHHHMMMMNDYVYDDHDDDG